MAFIANKNFSSKTMSKREIDLGEDEGVWRTVGGRRIFIREGQSLESAMKESGKFKSTKNSPSDKEVQRKKQLKESIKNTPTSDFVDDDDRYDKDTGKALKVSLNKYLDKDGKLTPEREKLHQKIIDSYFEGKTPVPEGEEKLFYMTGGGSGTGKSNFVNDTKKYYGKDFKAEKTKDKTTQFKGNMIKLDADDIKIKLGLDKNDPKSASYLHGESSALVKRITTIAQDNGYNVMLDGTGDGGIKGMKGKIDTAHAKVYKVYANYGTVSQEEALRRNWNRYVGAKEKGENPRLVPPSDVVSTHAKVSAILPELAEKFDGVNLYYNGGKEPVLIASGGNGKGLSVTKGKEKEYVDFLAKKDYNIDDYKKYYKYWRKIKREG